MRHFKRIIFFTFSLIATTIANGQLHWESLILESDTFLYLVPETEPSADWIQLDFNDTAWVSGKGGFGYGDGDDSTLIASATTSIYLRKVLTMPASVPVKQLLLDIDYDDAFVAYINGVEVARSQNLKAGTPGMDGSVTVDHEALMYSGGSPERFILNPDLLIEGNNILAVHIMNVGITSTDLSARIFLNAELDSNQLFFNPTPDWFKKPLNFEESNLPIIRIQTSGKTIVDEPKITAIMEVINNPDGINKIVDTTFEYEGYIGIEIRGNTAQGFPKKSYTVETRLSNGENNNVPLLGMPQENDWVFHGPYSDKSLMRNALAYNIGNSMGRGWHPRARFVELEINNEYRGVYLVVEKIKIDKNRVDIAKLLPGDTTGNELTGGYIISIDRDQEGSWNSPFMGRTGSVDVPFSYVDPKYDELTIQQRNYIREYITDFEYALDGSDYKDPLLGYRAYINIISFIDYFIITELSKDLDGYRVSVYFHKDKDSKDGRLTMTPFWDYNICFGNANFFSAGNPSGWASDGIGSGDWYEIPFWWDKFRTDPYFETLLKLRWEELRENVLSKSTLNQFIDSVNYLLTGPQDRNFQKFDILSTYVWPNNYIGGTYENEVNYLKNWISDRIDWLDGQIETIVPLNLQLPTIYTRSASDIGRDSATIGGSVLNDGGSYVWERGIYWAADSNLVQNGEKIKIDKGEGRFSTKLIGLSPDTEYFYMAYAENDLGVTYGDKYSFKTDSGIVIPTILSLEANNITMNSAVVGGNVIGNGGDQVTERGIYWHTETFPELFGSKIKAGSGNGTFTVQLDGLVANQVYFIKPYATNNAGTAYGEQYSFTTLKDTISVINHMFALVKDNIIVYPNPFSENITIKMDLEFECHVEIVMSNIVGEVVNIQSRDCPAGTNQFFYNDDNFMTGQNLFFYNILIDGIPVKRGKIVKQ